MFEMWRERESKRTRGAEEITSMPFHRFDQIRTVPLHLLTVCMTFLDV